MATANQEFDFKAYLESQGVGQAPTGGPSGTAPPEFDFKAYLEGRPQPTGAPKKQAPVTQTASADLPWYRKAENVAKLFVPRYIFGGETASVKDVGNIVTGQPSSGEDFVKGAVIKTAQMPFNVASTVTGGRAGQDVAETLENKFQESVQRHPTSAVGGELGSYVAPGVGAGKLFGVGKGAGVATTNLAKTSPKVAKFGDFLADTLRSSGALALESTGTYAKPEDRLEHTLTNAAIGAALPGAEKVVNKVIRGVFKPSNRVDEDALFKSASTHFQKASDAGIEVEGNAFKQGIEDIRNTLAKEEGYIPKSYPKVDNALNEMLAPLKVGDLTFDTVSNKSYEELRRLRKVIVAAQKSIEPEERRLATILKDEFDNYIATLDKSSLTSTNPAKALEGLKAWREGRAEWSRIKKGEIFDEMIRVNELTADNKFSQAGIERALSQELDKLVKNPRRMRLFTPEERQVIEEATKGGNIQGALRYFGKLAPQGSLSSMLYGGALTSSLTAGNLKAAATTMGVAGASKIAREMAAAIRKRDVGQLAERMRAGEALSYPEINVFNRVMGKEPPPSSTSFGGTPPPTEPPPSGGTPTGGAPKGPTPSPTPSSPAPTRVKKEPQLKAEELRAGAPKAKPKQNKDKAVEVKLKNGQKVQIKGSEEQIDEVVSKQSKPEPKTKTTNNLEQQKWAPTRKDGAVYMHQQTPVEIVDGQWRPVRKILSQDEIKQVNTVLGSMTANKTAIIRSRLKDLIPHDVLLSTGNKATLTNNIEKYLKEQIPQTYSEKALANPEKFKDTAAWPFPTESKNVTVASNAKAMAKELRKKPQAPTKENIADDVQAGVARHGPTFKKEALKEIDKHIAKAKAKEDIKGEIPRTTIEIPNDGKFKLLNTKERLEEFRTKFATSTTLKSPKGKSGPRNDIKATLSDLLNDKEYSAATEYAKLTGQTIDKRYTNLPDYDEWLKNPEKFETKMQRQKKIETVSGETKRKLVEVDEQDKKYRQAVDLVQELKKEKGRQYSQMTDSELQLIIDTPEARHFTYSMAAQSELDKRAKALKQLDKHKAKQTKSVKFKKEGNFDTVVKKSTKE